MLTWVDFEWDARKEILNLLKHGVDFQAATRAFEDPRRVIIRDAKHSRHEMRLFCIGHDGRAILTVRFVLRSGRIRILGAGYWRKATKIYEKENQIHG
jgi:uncharacterized DUF497 family protein